LDAFFFWYWSLAMNKTDSEIIIPQTEINHDKRDFLKRSAALTTAAAIMSLLAPGVRSGAWAAGSDAPEKTEVKVGFIPLTDCASVAIAAEKGFEIGRAHV
jgi:nitrate/nitrite transport system substrate-binding protein